MTKDKQPEWKKSSTDQRRREDAKKKTMKRQRDRGFKGFHFKAPNPIYALSIKCA